jgi:hypothetical protein
MGQIADLLQHAQAQRQIEDNRMANVAGGGQPGPVTPDVQAIQDRVAAGTQNQGAIPGEVNPANEGLIGWIASMLAPQFASKPTPAATPTPSPEPTPPVAVGGPAAMSEEERRQAECLKKTGQYCPD